MCSTEFDEAKRGDLLHGNLQAHSYGPRYSNFLMFMRKIPMPAILVSSAGLGTITIGFESQRLGLCRVSNLLRYHDLDSLEEFDESGKFGRVQ